MNTYNDNLRSTVLATLGTLEQEIKTVESNVNTAMFTLYYAEGATINAAEQLQESEKQRTVRGDTKRKAVENNNLGNNSLATANQANTCVQQAVTNTSVGAANVQVAANAILQLAGDMGNILNIAKAADFGSEIKNQAQAAESYISDTAYEAERVSQFAMEAAILTSGVSASTVQSTASSSATAIGNLLAVTSSDYDAIAQAVLADNADLATLSANARLANGVYLDATTEQQATNEAYSETSAQLNLGLTATTVTGKESTDFTVSFDWLKSPFKEIVPATPSLSGDQNFADLYYPLPYPVTDYYLFVVNEVQKNTFTLSDAEDIVSRQVYNQFIDLQSVLATSPLPKSFSQSYTITSIPNSNPKAFGGQPYQLLDTGGNKIKTGKRYVVFVMAKYAETYKKKLNSFEDFLSAPSASFYFTNILAAATASDSNGTTAKVDSSVSQAGTSGTTGSQPVMPTTISINVSEKSSVLLGAKPEYRCIFLPVASAQSTQEQLPFIFNIPIAAQVSAANYTKATISSSGATDTTEDSTAAPTNTKGEKVKAKHAGAGAPSAVTSTADDEAQDTDGEASTDDSTTDQIVNNSYTITLSAATTDNFGNELNPDAYYLPVVLSISEIQESALNPTYTSNMAWLAPMQVTIPKA